MKRKWFGSVPLAVLLSCSSMSAANLSVPPTAPQDGWRKLSAPHHIWPCSGAIYYSFPLPSGSRAHLVVVDTKSGNWRIRPAMASPSTAPTSTTANENHASAATNGGYFNLKQQAGQSTSYIVLNGTTITDPHTNNGLVKNPHLIPFLDKIMNRSEIRFLQDAHGKRVIKIAHHYDALPAKSKLIDSLQAGPALLPSLDAEDEAFIRKDAFGTVTDSIGVNKEAARTAFGITPDGYALMLCVAGKGQDPESSGITLTDLAALMKQLGCVEAINLDGGSSTTMYVRMLTEGASVKDSPQPPGTVVVGKSPETLVKSILMLEPVDKR